MQKLDYILKPNASKNKKYEFKCRIQTINPDVVYHDIKATFNLDFTDKQKRRQL